MSAPNRRQFLQKSGAVLLPAILPFTSKAEAIALTAAPVDEPGVNFLYDGDDLNPARYIDALQKINAKEPVKRDFYGQGGAVTALEKKMAELTGKEKAIYMPTGTMANQLAIAVLSGEKTKVFVQDNSHVYRDEADAAQSVFGKRLMPLAMGQTYFTADELKSAIEGLKDREVFASGIGAVSIENPVRRTEGRMVPLEEIREISAYCRANQIPLHLDGARIFMAAAWSGVSVKEYASYFDTVYISLYKYFGAAGGAILCGNSPLIEQMPHQIKIHGGTVFGSWVNAAMALHQLEGFENRLQEAIKRAAIVFEGLNKIPGVKVAALDGGTNIYSLEVSPSVGAGLPQRLMKEFNIRIPPINDKGRSRLTVNETLLNREPAAIISAFEKCFK